MRRSDGEDEIENRDQSSCECSVSSKAFRLKLPVVFEKKSQVKNVDDLDRVEKISKDIRKKSEALANDGESTPYITKGMHRAVNCTASLSFPSIRGTQGDETSNDVHRPEEHRSHRCLSEQETQALGQQDEEADAHPTGRRGRQRLAPLGCCSSCCIVSAHCVLVDSSEDERLILLTTVILYFYGAESNALLHYVRIPKTRRRIK